MRRSSGLSGWFNPQHDGCFKSNLEMQELQLTALLPLETAYPNLYDSDTVGIAAFTHGWFWHGNEFAGKLDSSYLPRFSTVELMLAGGVVNA